MTIVASGQITITDLNDSRQLMMYIGASQSKTVVFDGIATYTPDYSTANQELIPQLYIAGDNIDMAKDVTGCRWYYQDNGADAPVEIIQDDENYTLTQIGTKGLKSLTIKNNVLASKTSMTYICELIYQDIDAGINATTKADIEIVKITNGLNGTSGKDAIVAVLTNETANVLSNSTGQIITYDGASTQLNIYKGVTDDTDNWAIFQVRENVTVSEPSSSKTATVTAMSADTGRVIFKATKNGHPQITKVFNINKVKSGEDATSYDLNISTPVLVLNKEKDSFNPIDLTVSARMQVGMSEPFDYPTHFTVEESLDGVNFATTYTSSNDEFSFVYTPTSFEIKSLKIKMYLEGGTETLLDEQIVPVISDGTDAVYANVWTPDGNAIKNSIGTVKARIDLYNGAKTVSGSSYKWYIQDGNASPTSGGDSDGGQGWRLLNDNYNAGVSGYTTAEITIPSSAIASTEAFKCVAVYNGNNYSGVTTVVDLSDPIIVRLDGMDKFKNGEGSIIVRATLLQSGSELDPNGTEGYIYEWYIYDSNNNKTSFKATGKTIIVHATDISGRGNLICEVSK
ncbi:hypothetical protein [Bacillus licheniformis]|uniref:hypothetical protein n=1 Tax=Bacillus licheniformis TaxID=1402 RepID=UPI000926631D|nr:hypothetical protein [Bacillus licheniformis]OJT57281.1 hypothetical protein BFP47_11235 [Bacillus licheniformis]OJT70077.1 hypothetical protein BFP46_05655 [Bacillus licheniformis]